MSEQNKRLYNLANPSDPYTLFAPSLTLNRNERNIRMYGRPLL